MAKHALDSEEDEPQQNEYLVEVITQARVVNNKTKDFEYYVKWHGYTSDDDTWEPESNVQQCTRLLKSFWKNVGKDKRKHPGPPGTEYKASKEWISKERRNFAEEMRMLNERTEAERKEREKGKKAAKIDAGDDAATKSRSAKTVDVLNLFQDVDDDANTSGAQSHTQSKGKGKEETQMTAGAARTASSTTKPKPLQKLSTQTESNTNSTNKYAKIKITRKPTSIRLANPLDSPTDFVRDVLALNEPRSSLGTTASASSSTPTQKVAPTRETNSSQQFIPPRPRSHIQAAAPASTKSPAAQAEDVDNFLATIPLSSHSETQKPENSASRPQATKTSIPVPSGLKFQKKWTWAGELFIDHADAADKLCEITIHSTSETSEIGFRLAQFLDDRDSLRFSKNYSRSELNLILKALKKVDQIAKIGYRRPEDLGPLTIFMKFLIKRNLVISCPAINHMGHAAEMIVFPSADKDLCERLNVPLPFRSANCLLIVMMPWHFPPSKYDTNYLRPDELRDTEIEKELEELRKELLPNLASKPTVETALRILGFDASFVKFLPSRKYCVWSYQVDPKPLERGRKFAASLRPETKALFDVLSLLKAENVGYDHPEARIVFVHVGAVRNIWRLPGIVDRRCDKPEVQFITYGSHESVQPEMWGFHEIYPLGGIVTFTATALLENPISVAEIIEQVHKHPHWECYILPSVLAVFVRLSCLGEDPLSVYEREPYHFGRILELIEEGKVALMQSPSVLQGSQSEFEEAQHDKWIVAQFASITKTPVQLLEDCWSTFVAEYSNKTETEQRSTIEQEIVKDLTNLQTQHIIRENYRRFVVIKAMQDDHLGSSTEGFEWRTAQEFSFGDRFPVHTIDLTRGSEQPLAA